MRALIVRAVARNFLRAGAQARNGSGDFLSNADFTVLRVGDPGGLIVHQTVETADGSGFAHEEWERNLDRAFMGFEAFEHARHELAYDVGVERLVVFFNEGDEARHVRSLLVSGKRDGGLERGDAVLRTVFARYRNGERDAADADSRDGDVPAVVQGLDVGKGVLFIEFHRFFLGVPMSGRASGRRKHRQNRKRRPNRPCNACRSGRGDSVKRNSGQISY